jgi:initiation factor 1A
MVKNTTGGTGTKSLARKHQSKGNNLLRLPDCELEIFAVVTKMLGNGRCEVSTNDNQQYSAIIRNKFRGRQKRHNIISINSIVLIGLHDWEKPVKNSDILSIYNENEIDILLQNPRIDITNLIKKRISGNFNTNAADNNDDVLFTNDIDDYSDEEETNIKINKHKKHEEEFVLDNSEEIDIDDI